TSASSSSLFGISPALFLPRGSSPFFFSGLRKPSRILRKAPLLARSPRKPSSSFNSTLKLSTSTDGRRVAPWRAMPVVVMVSSAMSPEPLPDFAGDNGRGTHWFHGGEWRMGVANRGPPARYSPRALRLFGPKSFIFGGF